MPHRAARFANPHSNHPADLGAALRPPPRSRAGARLRRAPDALQARPRMPGAGGAGLGLPRPLEELLLARRPPSGLLLLHGRRPADGDAGPDLPAGRLSLRRLSSRPSLPGRPRRSPRSSSAVAAEVTSLRAPAARGRSAGDSRGTARLRGVPQRAQDRPAGPRRRCSGPPGSKPTRPSAQPVPTRSRSAGTSGGGRQPSARSPFVALSDGTALGRRRRARAKSAACWSISPATSTRSCAAARGSGSSSCATTIRGARRPACRSSGSSCAWAGSIAHRSRAPSTTSSIRRRRKARRASSKSRPSSGWSRPAPCRCSPPASASPRASAPRSRAARPASSAPCSRPRPRSTRRPGSLFSASRCCSPRSTSSPRASRSS